ncbi:MAG TPA: hypothetical protein VF920_10175 [Dongiaceae bacterium]
MTRRNWLLIVVLGAVLALVAIVSYTRQQVLPPAIDAAGYKAGFIDNCLKQANAVALQQSKAFNEEQKRVLQQICGCGADRTLEKFTQAEINAFQANPNDPAMLSRIKEIMQTCATETKMPTTNQ